MRTNETKARKIIKELFNSKNNLFDFNKYQQYINYLNNPKVNLEALNNSEYAKYNKENEEYYNQIIEEYGELEIHISRSTRNSGVHFTENFLTYLNMLCRDEMKIDRLYKVA